MFMMSNSAFSKSSSDYPIKQVYFTNLAISYWVIISALGDLIKFQAIKSNYYVVYAWTNNKNSLNVISW